MSIDGVGAYDLISRNAMLEGLFRLEGGDQILPFVRCFYGSPSTYLWEDEMGVTQSIPQGEGGEQGDLLMPLLYALGQHGALLAMQARLGAGEYVFAYLLDIHTVTGPARVDVAHVVVEEELWSHARIHLHHRKTQVWSKGSTELSGVEAMTRAAQAVKNGTVVWRGNPMLPTTQQGLKVLGIPIGHEAFVQRFLENKTTEQQVLFQRIPWVNDPQSACLLLLMCGSTRAHCWLRALRPEDTESFARRRRERVDMPSPDSWHAECPVWCAHFGDPCTLGRWAWIGQRGASAPCRTLDELGQLPSHGQTATPSHCGTHDLGDATMAGAG